MQRISYLPGTNIIFAQTNWLTVLLDISAIILCPLRPLVLFVSYLQKFYYGQPNIIERIILFFQEERKEFVNNVAVLRFQINEPCRMKRQRKQQLLSRKNKIRQNSASWPCMMQPPRCYRGIFSWRISTRAYDALSRMPKNCANLWKSWICIG